MVLRSRREYLEAIRLRYRRSGKKDKSVILDEFCAICGYNRKYAIRLLKNKHAGLSSRKRPGPRSIYGDDRLLIVFFSKPPAMPVRPKKAMPFRRIHFATIGET